MDKVWIKAEFWVGQTFSYRAPDFSSNYALSSPLPGPSATKLALVSTAIEMSGDIDKGKQVFDIIKSAKVFWEPSEWVSIFKAFIKRLNYQNPAEKAGKEGKEKAEENKGKCQACGRENVPRYKRADGKLTCAECAGIIWYSFGIREYCTYSGPIILYLGLSSESDAEQIINVLKQVRRMGSSDSILTLKCPPQILDKEPELKYTYHPISQVEIDTQNFTHRLVLPLKDLDESDTFEKINPYESGNPKLKQEVYIFPLKLEKKAENWTLYKKCSFNGLKETCS